MVVWWLFFFHSCDELLISLVDPTTLNNTSFSPFKCNCLRLQVTLNESGCQSQYRAFILHTQNHCMLIYFSAWHKNQSSSKSSAHSPPPPPVQPPKPPSPIRAVKLEFQDQEIHKLEKFGKLLAGPNTDLGKNIFFYILLQYCDHLLMLAFTFSEAIRKLSWSGIPVTVRPTTWQLLCVSWLSCNWLLCCSILYGFYSKATLPNCSSSLPDTAQISRPPYRLSTLLNKIHFSVSLCFRLELTPFVIKIHSINGFCGSFAHILSVTRQFCQKIGVHLKYM